MMLHTVILHKPFISEDGRGCLNVVSGEVVVGEGAGGTCPTLERMQTRGKGKGQRSITAALSFTCPWWQEGASRLGGPLGVRQQVTASSSTPCKEAESRECRTISSSPTMLSMFRYTHQGLALQKQCVFLLNLERLSWTLLSLRQWVSAPQGLQRWVFFPLHFYPLLCTTLEQTGHIGKFVLYWCA